MWQQQLSTVTPRMRRHALQLPPLLPRPPLLLHARRV
jgi:hypothetical protein